MCSDNLHQQGYCHTKTKEEHSIFEISLEENVHDFVKEYSLINLP